MIKDDELLKKYNKVWKKVKNTIDKEFDSEPVYNGKYLKAKIKSYKGKINTNFHNNKIPKEDSQCICLSVILIDSGSIKKILMKKVLMKKILMKNINFQSI